jgi:hypothetical protein
MSARKDEQVKNEWIVNEMNEWLTEWSNEQTNITKNDYMTL